MRRRDGGQTEDGVRAILDVGDEIPSVETTLKKEKTKLASARTELGGGTEDEQLNERRC